MEDKATLKEDKKAFSALTANYDELLEALKKSGKKLKDLDPSLTQEQVEWIENDLEIYKQNK